MFNTFSPGDLDNSRVAMRYFLKVTLELILNSQSSCRKKIWQGSDQRSCPSTYFQDVP